ncbi:WD40 repeat-like protein [Paxillus ammoniavirescens]|nr:WD40 repeat-like protein [Paxillus ammoniavirescens]
MDSRGQRPPPVAEHQLGTDLDPEMLPMQVESFARDFATFLDCLNEFPDLSNGTVNQSMEGFEADLKYWASCLAEYKGQLGSPAVRRYIHDLTPEIGDHIDKVTRTLSMFIEIGLPTMRLRQQNDASRGLTLSTVATFFSAVTATTLQYSYNATGDVLSDSVNALWFSSLLLSIAAAVNGLFGLNWEQAIYRSPLHRVPWWILIWSSMFPVVFLVMSVACFSAGLVLFTYSSGQGPVTSTIISVLTAVILFGYAVTFIWFGSERWVFIQYSGQKWLQWVVSEVTDRMCNPFVRASRITLHWCHTLLAIARGYSRRLMNWVVTARAPTELLPYYLRPPRSHPPASPQPHIHPQNTASTITTALRHDTALVVSSVTREHLVSSEGRSEEGAESRQSDARQRFINAIRSVIMLQSTVRPIPPRPVVDRSELSPGRFPDPGMSALRGVRMTNAIEKLKALITLQEIGAHQALVRHLQFSPDGRYLATSSWDRTAVIFHVGENLTTHRILVHVRGFIGQVAWSPNGRILLTRLTRAVKVWSEDGVCRKTIDRPVPVQSIVWLPNGEGFLSVEGSDLVKLDLQGTVLDTYHIGEVRLTNVAVTADCARLVCVGPSIVTASRPQPNRHTRIEKRIIVYNMSTKTKESQIPFANDVRDITMARKSSVVLISPEKAAPQLWKLEIVRDRDRSGYAHTSRLSFKHTFALKFPVDIVGPCHFGGKDDQFVLCAAKTGDIHIWDRETATLLHCIRPQNAAGVGDLTCIGWNYATDDPMMFATGSHDGTVRIYSTAREDSESDNALDAERRTGGERATSSSVRSGG